MRGGLVVVALAAALAGCGQSKTACFGLSDADAVARVVKDDAAQPASSKGDAAQTQFSQGRVVGIGRNAETKDSGKGLTQIWFSQDDHTVTVATLAADCAMMLRPGLDPEAIKSAAIEVRPAHF